MEERVANAFFMLAKVVEQNTMMYEALIVAINSAPSTVTAEQASLQKTKDRIEKEKTTPVKEHHYTIDDCKVVLTKLVTTKGKDQGLAHLKNYNATSISQVPEDCYENFVLVGQQRIDGGYDS